MELKAVVVVMVVMVLSVGLPFGPTGILNYWCRSIVIITTSFDEVERLKGRSCTFLVIVLLVVISLMVVALMVILLVSMVVSMVVMVIPLAVLASS